MMEHESTQKLPSPADNFPLLCWVAKKSFRDVEECDGLLLANASGMPLRERRKTPHVPLVFMTETPVITEAGVYMYCPQNLYGLQLQDKLQCNLHCFSISLL